MHLVSVLAPVRRGALAIEVRRPRPHLLLLRRRRASDVDGLVLLLLVEVRLSAVISLVIIAMLLAVAVVLCFTVHGFGLRRHGGLLQIQVQCWTAGHHPDPAPTQ